MAKINEKEVLEMYRRRGEQNKKEFEKALKRMNKTTNQMRRVFGFPAFPED